MSHRTNKPSPPHPNNKAPNHLPSPRTSKRFSHDELFRLLFTDPSHLAAFVRAALPNIAPLLDLHHPACQDTTFIDRATKRRVSDVLWQIPILHRPPDSPPPGSTPKHEKSKPSDTSRPAPCHIYVLFEHKSQRDRDVFFQILDMMIQVWDRYRDEWKRRHSAKTTKRHTAQSIDRQASRPPGRPPDLLTVESFSEQGPLPPKHVLPIIVPLVVSNHKGNWKPTQMGFRSQFRAHPELLDLVPTVPIVHVSLPDHMDQLEKLLAPSDADLTAGLKMMTLTAKGVDRDGLAEALGMAARGSWAKGDRNLVSALLAYVMHGKMELGPEEVVAVATEALGDEAEEEMTTYVQAWYQDGFKKGIEEGIQKGIQKDIQKGRVESLQDVLVHLLERRFGALPQTMAEEIRTIQSEDVLVELTVQAAEVESLDTFAAHLSSHRH